MADLKSAQKLLDEIPRNDSLKALQELTSWLESVSEEASFRADHQYAVLNMLNEAARPHERKLTREYFSVAAPQKQQENRLWMALTEFYSRGAHACLTVIRRCLNSDKGAALIKADLPVVTTRGMVFMSGRLKFAAVRYGAVEPEVWGHLAELYTASESLGFPDAPVAMYTGANGNSTVRKEFATVLMWYATCAGTVGRLDVHLAQRLAAHLRDCFALDRYYSPDSLFSFDLLNPGPPVRLNAPGASGNGLLFIGVEHVQDRIAEIIRILDKGFVPEDINLGGDYDAELVGNVLRRLAAVWSLPPRSRRSARHKMQVSMFVLNGMVDLMESVRTGDYLSGIEPAVWETDDIGGGGFRAVLNPRLAEGLEIGSIIGARPQNVEHWGFGIVRRIGRDRKNNVQIGVELFTNNVRYVDVHEIHGRIGEEEQPALLVENENSNEVMLLLPPQVFSSGHSLRISMDGGNYLLIPLELLDMGQDYDFARYHKVAQETD